MKHIAMIYDVKGWAFWNKAESLQKHLKDWYRISLRHFSERERNGIDLFVFFSPGSMISFKPKAEPLICGIASHNEKYLEIVSRHEVTFTNDRRLFGQLSNPNKFYLPNGVDTEHFTGTFRILPQKRSLRIGIVGNIALKEHKGHKRILDITSALRSRGFNVQVNGLWVDPCKSLKNKNQMRDYYRDVDVFVVSSVSECTPNPLLEAMAMGIPCVSNDTGMASQLIESGVSGFLVDDYNDLDAYVGAISRLMTEPGLYETVGAAGRKSVGRFSWADLALNYKIMFDWYFANLKH